MSIAFICIALLISTYTVWVMNMLVSWSKLKNLAKHEANSSVGLSIVVPFRNESGKIGPLINELIKQHQDVPETEIILVDDHSEDGSRQEAERIIDGLNYITLISLKENKGKKQALHTGIVRAKHEWIITLDSDVILDSFWMTTISKHCANSSADLLILPLWIAHGDNKFGRWQSLEFMSVIGITAGMANAGNPILCNGANLAFRKNTYMDSLKKRADHQIPGGDDMFLLTATKNIGKIHWIHDKRVLVQVEPEKNLASFINQRVRWAAKTGSLKDPSLWIISLLVFFTNAATLTMIFLAIADVRLAMPLLVLFTLRITLDVLLVYQVSKWLCKTRLMRSILCLIFSYPLYAFLIPLIGLFYTPSWKDRKPSK